MKKLTKEDLIAKAALLEELRSKEKALGAAVDAFNEAQNAAFKDLQIEIDSFNETVVAANEWLAEKHDEAEAFFEGRSETWKDGERGQAYQEWVDSFSEEGEEIDIDRPDEVDVAGLDFAIIDTLENVQDAPVS